MNTVQSATAYIRRSMVHGLGEVREAMYADRGDFSVPLDRRSIAMNEARVLYELTQEQEDAVNKRLADCGLHGDCCNGRVCENCLHAPLETARPVACSTPEHCDRDDCTGCPFQLIEDGIKADLPPIHGPGGLMTRTGMEWELDPENGQPWDKNGKPRCCEKFNNAGGSFDGKPDGFINPVKGLKLSLYPIRREC